MPAELIVSARVACSPSSHTLQTTQRDCRPFFYSVFILPVFHLFIVKFYHFLFRPDHTLSIACLDLVFIASQLDLTHIKAQLAE